MIKKVTIEIEYCNNRCPYFYHNYEDFDNIWCDKLNKKIFDCGDGLIMFDFSKRKIPDECPLQESNL